MHPPGKVQLSTKMTLFEILPCLFLLITTTQIIITARRHWRKSALLNSQLQYNEPNRQRTKDYVAAKVIVVVVFLSCYFVELYSVVGFLVFSSAPSKEVKEVISFLIPVNCAANPIAYALELVKRDIRKELQKTYRKHLVPRPRSGGGASTAV